MSKADVAKARSKIGKLFPGGCTEFVGSVLGFPQKNSSLWKRGEQVQQNQLSPGDVIGWGGNG